ncbi:MAG: HEPN domain-containing protein [bacterium]
MASARAIIHEYSTRLDGLFKKASAIQDLEAKAHWTRYLCVLASGYLEVSVRSIAEEYAATVAHPNVANFVASSIEDFHNPRMEKILEVVRCFNSGWAAELEKACEGELKASVDSIVINRHLIAHGNWTGLSFGVMSRYYDGASKVVNLLLIRFSL